MSDNALHYELYKQPLPKVASTEPVGTTRTDDTLVNVRSGLAAMMVAFGMFAVFGSDGIRHFALDLPGNALTDAFVAGAERWHSAMLALGPARVAPAVHDAVEALRAIGW